MTESEWLACGDLPEMFNTLRAKRYPDEVLQWLEEGVLAPQRSTLDAAGEKGEGVAPAAGGEASGGRAVDRGREADLIREVVSNPFRIVPIRPEWKTFPVVALARAIEADRAFQYFPLLGDALRSAGCENPDILEHCHQRKPHHPDCWLLNYMEPLTDARWRTTDKVTEMLAALVGSRIDPGFARAVVGEVVKRRHVAPCDRHIAATIDDFLRGRVTAEHARPVLSRRPPGTAFERENPTQWGLYLDDDMRAVVLDADPVLGYVRAVQHYRLSAPGVRLEWSDPTACDLIREWVGNPFRTSAVRPEWLTSTVVALARGIRAERAFDRMPILADALMDAGCADEAVLGHLRGPGPHDPDCWVLRLLVGPAGGDRD